MPRVPKPVGQLSKVDRGLQWSRKIFLHFQYEFIATTLTILVQASQYLVLKLGNFLATITSIFLLYHSNEGLEVLSGDRQTQTQFQITDDFSSTCRVSLTTAELLVSVNTLSK